MQSTIFFNCDLGPFLRGWQRASRRQLCSRSNANEKLHDGKAEADMEFPRPRDLEDKLVAMPAFTLMGSGVVGDEFAARRAPKNFGCALGRCRCQSLAST
jgi:hypothetical protein